MCIATCFLYTLNITLATCLDQCSSPSHNQQAYNTVTHHHFIYIWTVVNKTRIGPDRIELTKPGLDAQKADDHRRIALNSSQKVSSDISSSRWWTQKYSTCMLTAPFWLCPFHFLFIFSCHFIESTWMIHVSRGKYQGWSGNTKKKDMIAVSVLCQFHA